MSESAPSKAKIRRTRVEMLLDLFDLLSEQEKCDAAAQIGKKIESFCEDRRRFYGGLLRQFCPKRQRNG